MRGRYLQILVNLGTDSEPKWVTIAQATSQKITISAQTGDTTTKDLGKVRDVTGRSWTISTEDLICDYVHDTTQSGAVHARKLLSSYMTSGTKIKLAIEFNTTNSEGSGSADLLCSGVALVTKFEANFPNRENSSFSAEFTGVGRLDTKQYAS